jgi:glycerate kinase
MTPTQLADLSTRLAEELERRKAEEARRAAEEVGREVGWALTEVRVALERAAAAGLRACEYAVPPDPRVAKGLEDALKTLGFTVAPSADGGEETCNSVNW